MQLVVVLPALFNLMNTENLSLFPKNSLNDWDFKKKDKLANTVHVKYQWGFSVLLWINAKLAKLALGRTVSAELKH